MGKRTYARQCYPIPIEISYFNNVDKFTVQSINHCEDGMCFKSNSAFKIGETLHVRVKDFHPHGGPCTGLCKGLRSMTLAEVRWCHEVSDKVTSHYQVGIKFSTPVY